MSQDLGSSTSTCDVNDVDENDGLPIFVVLRVLGAETVLRYVPVKDLLRSESVCKAWQRTVFWYLEKYCSIHLFYPMSGDGFDNCHWNASEKNPNNIKIAEKLGFCIEKVNLVNRTLSPSSEHLLKTIATKSLSLRNITMSVGELKTIAYFFKYIKSEIVTYINIELRNTRDSQNDQYLLTGIQNLACFANIKIFMLESYPIQLLKNIHLLILVMPKLEHLSLISKERYEEFETNEFIGSISRLSELKRLDIWYGGVSDALLEALAQGCSKLEKLDIGGYALDRVGEGRLTPKGLGALCRRSPSAATTLDLSYYDPLDRIKTNIVTLKEPQCQELDALCGVKLTRQHVQATRQAAGYGDRIWLELKSRCNADAEDPRQQLKIILNHVMHSLVHDS